MPPSKNHITECQIVSYTLIAECSSAKYDVMSCRTTLLLISRRVWYEFRSWLNAASSSFATASSKDAPGNSFMKAMASCCFGRIVASSSASMSKTGWRGSLGWGVSALGVSGRGVLGRGVLDGGVLGSSDGMQVLSDGSASGGVCLAEARKGPQPLAQGLALYQVAYKVSQ